MVSFLFAQNISSSWLAPPKIFQGSFPCHLLRDTYPDFFKFAIETSAQQSLSPWPQLCTCLSWQHLPSSHFLPDSIFIYCFSTVTNSWGTCYSMEWKGYYSWRKWLIIQSHCYLENWNAHYQLLLGFSLFLSLLALSLLSYSLLCGKEEYWKGRYSPRIFVFLVDLKKYCACTLISQLTFSFFILAFTYG